ncbi:phosphatase YidA [Klebsiella pneumoniae]|uniref:Phosphatase YidA n=1 Tax=Klebsiella pneumoniae TaxID=573 RepID=A0A377XJ46_KLEPN|nr:phosphatase YidA [Klebsiella pneumoniae]
MITALPTMARWCRRLVTEAPSRKPALSYDDYRFLEQLSREVGSHFHALDRNTLYTANRDISYYTVHESYVANHSAGVLRSGGKWILRSSC